MHVTKDVDVLEIRRQENVTKFPSSGSNRFVNALIGNHVQTARQVSAGRVSVPSFAAEVRREARRKEADTVI